MRMRCGLALFFGSLVWSSVATAQQETTGGQQAETATQPSEMRSIPALTFVDIEIVDPLDSKTNKPNDSFKIKLAEPIEIGGKILVPAGTPGMGEVVHASKARAAGKPGELILAARYLDYNGTRIPLRSFKYGKSVGKNNVDKAAAVAIVVASPLALFVVGGQVRIPSGTIANAKTSMDVAIPLSTEF
jgi:hypothetical protein